MPKTARLATQLGLLAIAFAVGGCRATDLTEVSYEAPAPGIQAGYVSVTPTDAGLAIVNHTERPVFLIALNAETLALLYWAPCFGGPTCPALAQGEERVIPWASVIGYAPGTRQYTVYWWHAIAQPDGTSQLDDMHNVTVTR